MKEFSLFEQWEVVLSTVGLIVWLVRLEGRVNSVEKANDRTQSDVDENRIRLESFDSKVVEQLAEMRESLARLEGALGIKK